MSSTRANSPALAPRLAGRVVAGCLLAMSFAGPAAAHPHIWVTTRTEVQFEGGTIVGFRHAWTFDEYYSATAIDGLDANKDGVYSREELAELAKVNVEALKDFGYFTFPRLAGAEVGLDAPKDFWLSHGPKPAQAPGAGQTIPVLPPAAGAPPAAGKAGAAPTGADRIAADAAASGVLTLHFTIPLAKPVLAEAKGFTFSVADPSFFIGFEPAADKGVTLGAGAPKECRVSAVDAKADMANPSKPGDLMAPQPAPADGITFVSAAEWQVVCGAR